MTNFSNTTLYIGVTNDLHKRVVEHKTNKFNSFTHRYHLTKLVYYEQLLGAHTAIDREKQLKGWKRDWKLDLIKQNSPRFSDLSESELGISLEDAGSVASMTVN